MLRGFRATALSCSLLAQGLLGFAAYARDPGTAEWVPVPPDRVAEECKLDPALLQQANAEIGSPYAIIRYGKLCHEYYPDDLPDTPEAVYSATKTLGAVVTGIVVWETRDRVAGGRKTGPLSDEDPVSHWLDDFSFNPEARVGHVLAMVAHNADLSHGAKTHVYDALGTDQINRLSDILNAAIAQDPDRLGTNLEEFTQTFLFQPLGMKDSTWSRNLPDKTFAYGWFTTIRDMARLGLLILNDGWWNGRRVLSEVWIDKLTHPAFEDANTGYGYLMWLASQSNYHFARGSKRQRPVDSCSPPSLWDEYPHAGLSESQDCNYEAAWSCERLYDDGVWSANGLGGQLIIGHPGLDMVLVGKDLGPAAQHTAIWSSIRPALVELDPQTSGDGDLFCDQYGSNAYAPDLKLPEPATWILQIAALAALAGLAAPNQSQVATGASSQA